MKYTFIALLAFVLAVPVLAGGGKMREANQVLTPDTCVISVPEGLEDEDCEEVQAPGQSGIVMFVCDGVDDIVFVCDD